VIQPVVGRGLTARRPSVSVYVFSVATDGRTVRYRTAGDQFGRPCWSSIQAARETTSSS